MKKRVGVGSISLLLVIIALVWSYSIFGFCLGDKVLSVLHLPVWSNGNEQIKNTFSIVPLKGNSIHYTAYYSLILLVPALAIKNKEHLFADIGKWLAVIFIVLLIISPLLVMI